MEVIIVLCPKCGLDVKNPIHNFRFEPLNVCFFKCPNCNEIFAGLREGHNKYSTVLKVNTSTRCPSRIQELSPKAAELYSNSLKAVSVNLYDFAGVGLRMALEQLTWDYLSKFKNIPEDKIPSNLYQMLQMMDSHIYADICSTVVREFGNDTVHIHRKLPALSLDDAFFAFEKFCEFIDSELHIIDLHKALTLRHQQKAK